MMTNTLKRWMLNYARRHLKEFFTPAGAVALPAGELDFHRSVGRGYNSNVILSPIDWVCRNFQQAPLVVERRDRDEFNVADPHPLTDLVQRPNPWYSGIDLMTATIASWFLDGNAYWVKIRNGIGRVVELWYAFPWMIEPKQDFGSADFITHYDYRPNAGQIVRLEPEEVVHFRNGIDAENPRKGRSTLQTIIREVFTDDEASRYTAFLLKNYGVPGIVMSPKDGETITDIDTVQRTLQQKTSGPRRGQPFVSSVPVNLEQFGFEPRRMELGAIRNITEERACAAIGVSPALVHFGTGVQQTKVGATLIELRAMGWQDCIVPMMIRMALQLQISLLTEFETRLDRVRTRYATEEVEALQESQDALAERNTGLYRGGLIRRSEARSDLGWDVGPEDEGYVHELEPQATGLIKTKHAGTRREQQVIEQAPSREPTETQKRLIRSIEETRVRLEDNFAEAVEKWGRDFGKAIASAAEDVVKAYKPNGSTKDANTDTNEILSNLDLAKQSDELKFVYESQYVKVALETTKTIGDVLGVAVGLPDEVSAQITALGGTQAGLVDLPKQTRKRLFEELTRAREEGLGVNETVRRIREFVPAGPWKDVKTRARVIARTETMNAQRRSVLAAYKQMDTVNEVMIFDNRTGFGDAQCTAIDGKIVSLDVAEALAVDEHPNGTRSFAPVV